MSESRRKISRRQKFLAEHPDGYFCGGIGRAITTDHVPPQACFPKGYVPEGFEFPACKQCNEGAAKVDQIFGYYSLCFDFDVSKTDLADDAKQKKKLLQGILNNYPDALPDLTTAYPIHQVGSVITPYPAAIVLDTPPALKEAFKMMGQKLTHAIYMRETGKILSAAHRFVSSCYQPQRMGTETLTSYFNSLQLPNKSVGVRPNIKSYDGDRFRYISGVKDDGNFLLYASQFGKGLILWSMVCGQNMKLPEVGFLASATWSRGACGPGASASE